MLLSSNQFDTFHHLSYIYPLCYFITILYYRNGKNLVFFSHYLKYFEFILYPKKKALKPALFF